MEDINFALVEEIRPPIYTAMKYWGKKPHNIWRTYIETYTPENGIYLDPFTGSAMSAIEGVKANRKTIAFDLNPLTSFIIEVLNSKFDQKKFLDEVDKIVSSFDNDEIYLKYFSTQSRHTKSEKAIVQSFKWNKNELYELGIFPSNSEKLKNKKAEKYLAEPNIEDENLIEEMKNLQIDYWYPNERFHNTPSISANFINCIGGNNFSNLWTKRNLYVISKIFDKILKITDDDLKKQLLFGFIQTIHLCTKMSVPRRSNAKRPFSTSWGRSAFICSSRKMEMNPLFVFLSSCKGKQSVESCLSSVDDYIGKKPKLVEVSHSHKNKNKSFDLKYGIVDVNAINDYIEDESIDFIMTDPPYGGLVQYFDLSSIWLNWLKQYDSKFKINFDAEITIKNGIIDLNLYQKRFTNAMKMLYKVLKPNGKIVFTFHNQDIQVWNAFLKSIALAGFKIEKVIHQQNRRTGESNVANPYGTSASDFYIRCNKAPYTPFVTSKDKFDHFVITKAIEIIGQRNEPTPYQILFNGLLTEISSAGFDTEDFDSNISNVLKSKVGEIFLITENGNSKAGNLWWFVEPQKFIKYPDKMLSDRVEDSIISLLRRKILVSLDEVLAEIFVKYPNGLTPDIKSIDSILKKYATKSSGKWLYNALIVDQEIKAHTSTLNSLMKIGRKLGFEIFIGKREQPELLDEKSLGELIDYRNLDFLNLDPNASNRVEMVDMIWLKNKTEIAFILEVENSTKFTSGIQRGSNLDLSIPKLMVIPDKREKEFKSIRDPFFVDGFIHHNWSYLFYSDVEKLAQTTKITIDMLSKFQKFLK